MPNLIAGAEAGNPMALAHLETRPACEWPYHWQAFADLSTERQLGFGAVGPIPNSMVDRMADRDGLSEYEASVLNYVIRLLDNKQRELAHDKAEKQRKRASS